MQSVEPRGWNRSGAGLRKQSVEPAEQSKRSPVVTYGVGTRAPTPAYGVGARTPTPARAAG
eukprot:194175-Rhodomonas_salina.1